MSQVFIPKINKEEFSQGEWQYTFTKSILTNSKEIEKIGEKLELQQIPEILFNDNKVSIGNKNIEFNINCQDCLQLCNYSFIKENIKKENDLNIVKMIPQEIQLKQHQQWKEKVEQKMIENPDIKIIHRKSDPFYSSPYMGTIIQKGDFNIRIEETQQEIPINRLGQNNPIVWGNMIQLYEDELGDNGQVQTEFRFRTMKDCWFGLLRHYLRVDDVVVRIYDTRLFYDFNQNYILREFSAKEDSYEKVKQKGFKFTPKLATDHNQSFLIQDYLTLNLVKKDKIFFK